MLDIQLEINNHPLRLGMNISDCRNYLSDKKTSKTGFLTRRMALVEKNTIVYFNKNCRLDCFDGKLTIIPNLTTATSADEMYATSGYISFKEGLINKIYFQVLDNRRYALHFFDEFWSICEKIYGQGKYDENSKALIESWEDNESILNVAFIPKYGNMFFVLGRKSIINLPRSLEGIQLGTPINAFENNPEWKEHLDHSFSGQRVFSEYANGKQFVCHFEFDRLHLISLTTFTSQTDFYLKQFTDKYGIPNRLKRNHYVWENDATHLLLVKGHELSIIMEDKNK